MITLCHLKVPVYLRESDFFRSIEVDDDEFEVPIECFKGDSTVQSRGDLTLLLSTLRFWGVAQIPAEVVTFTAWHRPREVISAFHSFRNELRYLDFLEALCIEMDKSSGNADFCTYVNISSTRWRDNTYEAAAQLCRIQYENENGVVWNAGTCALAARFGLFSVLTLLHELGCPWNDSTCAGAAGAGSLACLKYAHEHGCPLGTSTCSLACISSSLPCLQYAHEHGCSLNEVISILSFLSKECVNYLKQHSKSAYTPHMCAVAAVEVGIAQLQRLREDGCPWDSTTCLYAATAKNLPALIYAHENGCPWNEWTCYHAAMQDSLSCLQYAHEHGCPWSDQVMAKAASQSLACLRYMHEQGHPWSTRVCEAAAEFKGISTLQYAHEHGCPWDAGTCTNAAKHNNVEALRYAHEKDCTWDAGTIEAALQKESFSCFVYALHNNCPTDAKTCSYAAAAGLQYLIPILELGWTWDASTCAAAAKAGKLECLQYLHQHGCIWDIGAIYVTIEAGHVDCLTYMHQQGCAWDSTVLLQLPRTIKSRKCLEYVQDHSNPFPQEVKEEVVTKRQCLRDSQASSASTAATARAQRAVRREAAAVPRSVKVEEKEEVEGVWAAAKKRHRGH